MVRTTKRYFEEMEKCFFNKNHSLNRISLKAKTQNQKLKELVNTTKNLTRYYMRFSDLYVDTFGRYPESIEAQTPSQYTVYQIVCILVLFI